MPSHDSSHDPRDGLLGSGLTAPVLSLILVVTILVFLFWGGPLWSAPTGASHAGRIVVSYLAAIPLVALALRVQRRWSWVKWASGIALLWGAKLVLTTSVYPYLTPGSAWRYSPARPWQGQRPAAPRARRHYVEAAAPISAGDVEGTVTRAGSPVGGAIVAIEDPPPGRPAGPSRDVALHIESARYDRAAYLASTIDRLWVRNHDGVLHTLRIWAGGRALRNVPVTSRDSAQDLAGVPPGSYRLGCENHRSEAALLLVVDHPYAAITDDHGGFTLAAVPSGRRTVALFAGSESLRRPVEIAPGGRVRLTLDFHEPTRGKAE